MGLRGRLRCPKQNSLISLQTGRTSWFHPPKSKPELPLLCEARLTRRESLVPGHRPMERYCFQTCVFCLEFYPIERQPIPWPVIWPFRVALGSWISGGSYSTMVPRLFITVHDFNIILVKYLKLALKFPPDLVSANLSLN